MIPETEKPNLERLARISIEKRIAECSDPKSELDWGDIHDKWQRHAMNAVLDLQAAEKKIEEQSRELETSWRLVSEAFEEFARCQYARVAPMPTDGSLDTRWMKEAEQFLKGGK